VVNLVHFRVTQVLSVTKIQTMMIKLDEMAKKIEFENEPFMLIFTIGII